MSQYVAQSSGAENTASAANAEHKHSTWKDLFTKDYWQSWFIPPETDGEESYRFVRDPTLDKDGYMQGAWEEEAEIEYDQDLQAAKKQDWRLLDESKWLSVCCSDKDGAPVVLVCLERLPEGEAAPAGETLYRHLIVIMDSLVDAHYTALVVVPDSHQQHLAGTLLALRGFYERLPVVYKLRLKRLLLVNAHAVLKSAMVCVCPFFSHSLWHKISFVHEAKSLWEVADEEKLRPKLPASVSNVFADGGHALKQVDQENPNPQET